VDGFCKVIEFGKYKKGKKKKGKRNNQNCYKSIDEKICWGQYVEGVEDSSLLLYDDTGAHAKPPQRLKATRDQPAGYENIGYYGCVRACKTTNKVDSEKQGSDKTANR